MKDHDADPRQKAILKAAFTAFAAYGFRKTSMDDIARGAGMSRPALYLHYRNKEDIFRSLAQFYYDDAVDSVRAALARDLPLPDRLAGAFAAQGGAIIETMLTSPHGRELLDTGNATAADIAEAGEARLRAVYAGWLTDMAAKGALRLRVPPDAAAAAMTAALAGIKGKAPDHASYARDVATLGRLIGAGLEP
jgi:AcrR family transcriptional regulator